MPRPIAFLAHALAVALLLPMAAARADVVIDNFNADGSFSPTGNLGAAGAMHTTQTVAWRMAVAFTVHNSDYRLSSITLPISQQNTIPGNFLSVYVVPNVGASPAPKRSRYVEILSAHKIWPTFSNPFSTTTTLFSTAHPLLQRDSTYWIVAELDSLPALSTGQQIDYRWFTNTTNNDVPVIQQQAVGSGPKAPWPAPTSLNPAFRVNGDPYSSTCSLASAPYSSNAQYWAGPDAWRDVYWRLPGNCATCGQTDGLRVKAVEFGFYWSAPCTAHVRVAVVAASGPSGCETPDTTHVLSGPAPYTITGDTLGTTYALSPGNACIDQDAFVWIHFDDFGGCNVNTTPALYFTPTACTACTGYFATTVSHPSMQDWCSPDVGTPLWVQADLDCCSPAAVAGMPVPTVRLEVLGAPSSGARFQYGFAGSAKRHVELDVFDLFGRRIERLVNGDEAAGTHVVGWDGGTRAGRARPGVYEVRLRAGADVRSEKFVVVW